MSAAPPASRRLVVHYAEIGLKGGNRHRFERRLADRLREGLHSAGLDVRIPYQSGRFLVRLADDASEADHVRALEVVRRIPGVAYASPGVAVPPDLDAMRVAAADALEAAPPGSFKVETRRSDKRFPLNSIEISKAVAPACVERTGRPVDVHTPDVTVQLEVTDGGAYVSARRVPGPGGLPVGSSNRLLSFLSGGLDSVVATWMMIRRGARVTAVHFHNRTHEGPAILEKLDDLCGVLAWSAGRMRLAIVPFESCQRAIVGVVPAAYRMIVYRRAMFRIADRIASEEKALGLVTGDSLGQVASQTAENLRTIHAAATLPVYTPLVGSDKTEIIERARAIGTYDISVRPHSDCCSFLIARHPATRSRPEEVEAMEAPLDWGAIVEEAAAGTRYEEVPPDPAVVRGGVHPA